MKQLQDLSAKETLQEFLNATREEDAFVKRTVARIKSEITGQPLDEGEMVGGYEGSAPGKKSPKPNNKEVDTQQSNQKPLTGKDPVKGIATLGGQEPINLRGRKTKVILDPKLADVVPAQTTLQKESIAQKVIRIRKQQRVAARKAASPPIENVATESLKLPSFKEFKEGFVADFVDGFLSKLTGEKIKRKSGSVKSATASNKVNVNTATAAGPKTPKAPANPFGRAKHSDQVVTSTGPKVQQTQPLKPPVPPKPKRFAKSVASVWGNYPKNKPRPPGPESNDFDDSSDIPATTSKVSAGSNKPTDSSIGSSGHIGSGDYKKLLKNKVPMKIGNQKVSEDAPTNSMGGSSSIQGSGNNVTTFDPLLKKKPMQRKSLKDIVKGGQKSVPNLDSSEKSPLESIKQKRLRKLLNKTERLSDNADGEMTDRNIPGTHV